MVGGGIAAAATTTEGVTDKLLLFVFTRCLFNCYFENKGNIESGRPFFAILTPGHPRVSYSPSGIYIYIILFSALTTQKRRPVNHAPQCSHSTAREHCCSLLYMYGNRAPSPAAAEDCGYCKSLRATVTSFKRIWSHFILFVLKFSNPMNQSKVIIILVCVPHSTHISLSVQRIHLIHFDHNVGSSTTSTATGQLSNRSSNCRLCARSSGSFSTHGRDHVTCK